MESERNWWSKVKERVTSKYFIAALALFFLLVTVLFLFVYDNSKEDQFYPRSSHNLTERVIKMFIEQEYLNLTSYVDRIADTLPVPERNLVLFYKAESYFKQKKLQEAFRIFLDLEKSQIDFWQARFRMGCIQLLLGKKEQAAKLMEEISKSSEEVNFWKGLLYYELGDYKKALSYMKKVFYKPDALLISANIYLKIDEEDEALSHFLMLKGKYPSYREKALDAIIGIFEKNKNYPQLLLALEEYEKLRPQKIEIKRKKGMVLYQMGRKEEAYNLLSSETLAKKDLETFQLLAKIAFEMERFQEAAFYFAQYKLTLAERGFYIQALMKTSQYFKATLELKTYLSEAQGEVKDLTWGYYQLVECFMQTGEQENALLYTNKLLEMEKTADNYILLARIFKNGGNMPGYINALKLATEYEPKYINVLLDNLLQAKNYHEVDVITDKILKKDPYHEDALYYKSKQKFKQRFYDQAKIFLYTLIYLQLSDMRRKEEAFYMLGSILMQEGQLEDAEGFFTKALAINPTSLKSTLKLTMIHIKNGKLTAAKEILLRTKNQSQLPSKVLSVVYAYLGHIEAQEGSFEKARYYVDRALELNPRNEIAKSVLKRLE